MEPFKIKSVETIPFTTRPQREQSLAEAGYNLFNIPSRLITIDLLTDSGTSAMSDNQWAALMQGDESYAGSRNYFRFEKTVQRITGYTHVIPTHQGRVAENLLFTALVNDGDHIPNNIHFDTTRANIEHNGGVAVDCVIDEAYDPIKEVMYKGDMDLEKLDRVLADVGRKRIPLVLLTITNNSGGGQPVSLENAQQVSKWCRTHEIPFFFDACRFAENAYFNKLRSGLTIEIPELVRQFFDLADGCTMSAKKDGLVNMGGFVALNDDELAKRVTPTEAWQAATWRRFPKGSRRYWTNATWPTASRRSANLGRGFIMLESPSSFQWVGMRCISTRVVSFRTSRSNTFRPRHSPARSIWKAASGESKSAG
jgi:tryptophanase